MKEIKEKNSIENKINRIRIALNKKEFGKSLGLVSTFEDLVILKNYETTELFSLNYSEINNEIIFGELKNVDNIFVIKQFIKSNDDISIIELQEVISKAKKGWPIKEIKENIELTGPIVEKNDKKRIAYAAVLVPGEIDYDGEFVTKEKVEEAAHEWMENYQNIDLSHSLNATGKPVESYLTYSARKVKTIDKGMDLTLPEGTWILGSKLDEKTFEGVEKGEFTGYSIMAVARMDVTKGNRSIEAGLKSLEEDIESEIVLKKVLLKDLGPDWIPVAVSVVANPAVPKSKWFALKSKTDENKKNLLEKILSLLNKSKKEKQSNIFKLVKGGKENMTLKERITNLLASIKNEKGEIEEEKFIEEVETLLVEETKELEVKEPEVKEPEIKEPEVKELEVKEPEVKEPEVKEPEVKEPEATPITIEVLETIKDELKVINTQIKALDEGLKAEQETIKQMSKMLNLDLSKALKGQDGTEIKGQTELDFGNRDGFGRKKSK